MANDSKIEPFAFKDCALAAIATGLRAQNLRELRDHLADIHLGCIYYHFWGGLLRPHFEDPEYNNDFASWARHALHDERIEETEYQIWARPDQQFHFVRAQTVSLDTGRRLVQPAELAAIVPQLSLGSVFYHFIDARRREPQGVDDFRAWLAQFGDAHDSLRTRLAEVDPYFINLADLRTLLTHLFQDYFGEAQ
jgi:hypothetical protein